MDTTTSRQTAAEVGKILDALTTLSYDIECHSGARDDEKVLSARTARDTCAAIRGAVAALKRILAITEEHGGGLIAPETLHRLDAADPD